jgi:hypothetical protein
MQRGKNRFTRAFVSSFDTFLKNRTRRRPASARLRLESLEDRINPGGYTPTTFLDGGAGSGSFRAGIIQFNGDTGTADDTITLLAGTYTLTIANVGNMHEGNAATGDLNITTNAHKLIIVGAGTSGSSITTIDASKLGDRAFQITNPNTTVVFQNLIITGAKAQDNGINGVVAGTTDAYGGAILSNNNSNITLDNVIIENCTASGGVGAVAAPGFNAFGGAVYTAGSLTLQNGTIIEKDSAIGGNGGVVNIYQQGQAGGMAQGGGIYGAAGSSTSITVLNSFVQSNVARGGTGSAGGSKTGQPGLAGGAGGAGQGGGIYAAGGLMNLNGATIGGAIPGDANVAEGGAGGFGGLGTGTSVVGGPGGAGGVGQGGGLYVSNVSLAIAASTISTDLALGGKGRSGGSGGTAGLGGVGGIGGAAQGGGIYNTGGTIAIGTTSFASNVATGGLGGVGGVGGFFGKGGPGAVGGIAQGGAYFASGGTIALATSTFDKNTATGGAGGAGGLGGTSSSGLAGNAGNGSTGASGQGGGLYASGSSLLFTVTNCTIASNTAAGGNGGSGGTGGHGKTGGMGGNGGTGATSAGAGLYLNSGTLDLTNVTVAFNSANSSAGGAAGKGGTGTTTNGQPGSAGTGAVGSAGGLLIFGGTLNSTNTIFGNNTAPGGGTDPEVSGNFGTALNNLVRDGTGSNLTNGTNGNQVGTTANPIDPQFSAAGLANNGGTTLTIALQSTSPAINAGTPTGAPVVDQRLVPRSTITPDIGAFESLKIINVSSTVANGTYGTGALIPINVTFNTNVVVTGTPQLALNTNETVNFSTLTGTTEMTFNYTVVAGDHTPLLDYVNSNSLTLNGGTIKDSTGNNATLTLPVPGATGSLEKNNTIVINAVAPMITNVNSTKANGTYGTGTVIPIVVTFTAAVTVTGGTPTLTLNTSPNETASYVSGSGTTALTFDYTVVAGDTTSGNATGGFLDYTSTSALALNGATIQDTFGNSANLTLAAPGAAGSLSANNSIDIEAVAPKVTNVNSTTANGTYGIGTVIPIIVTFSHSVLVSGGTPTLSLDTSPGESASYVSGSGTSALTFDYTVVAGDTTSGNATGGFLDYTSTTAISLNGATIQDAVGNAANLTLASPGAAGSLSANNSIAIDAIAPVVNNVTSTTANGTYTTGTVIDIEVTFSKVVTVAGGTPTLALNTSPAENASYVSGSGTSTLTFDYTVVAGDSTSGLLDYASTSALSLNGATITDAVGNNAVLTLAAPGSAGSLSANKSITIDADAPVVTNVNSTTANGTYSSGTIVIVVTFGEVVNVTGTPALALNTTPSESASYVSGSGTSALTFDYIIVAGDSTSGLLDYTSTSALSLNGGTIQDATGNNANLTLAAPGSAGSLSANNSITIDADTPVIVGVSSTIANGAYTTGTLIPIVVTFGEAVNVSGGTPTLALNSGGTASYVSGSGTSALTFDYTVAAGDASALLDYTSTTALSLNGATIQDPAGNNANLTLAAPGAAGSLSANNSITIDTDTPVITNVNSTVPNGTYGIGALIPIIVSFGETVTVDTTGGTPTLALNTTPAENATYVSGSGTSALTFDYTVVAGDTISGFLDYASTSALSLNGATIKDVAGNAANLTLATPGSPGSLSANNNITLDADVPVITGVNTPTPSGTYSTGAVIEIDINFGETVTVSGGTPTITLNTTPGEVATYVGGSGTAGLIFHYTVVAGDSTSGFLDYTSTSAINLNGATIQDASGNNANLTLPTPGGGSSLSDFGITIDADAPVITNVNSTTANGTYTAGTVIPIIVTFGEVVNVTGGTPTLALNTIPGESATYVSGSGTNALTFDYTVLAGDSTTGLLDYASTSALSLNGATIQDPIGNNANLTLPAPGSAGSLSANNSISIDADSPVVTNVTSSQSGTFTTGQVITITVTFGEAVNVTGTPGLALNTTPAENASYTSGSGTANLVFTYTVVAGDASSHLDYASANALSLNGGSISDAPGNAAILTLPNPGSAGSLGANANIVIDTTTPTVTNISSTTANGSYTTGKLIDIEITFSKPVNVTGTPSLALNTTPGENATYVSGSGTSTLTFDYTVAAGDNSALLDYSSTAALSLNGGTIQDAGGLNAILTLPAPGAAGSLSANNSIVIDTISPSVTLSTIIVSPTNASSIPVTVTFSESVSGFSAAGIVVSDATIANFTESGAVYTFNLLPTAPGTVTAQVSAGAANDAAGNPNTASNTLSLTFDNVSPTVTVTPAVGQNGNTSVAPIIFTVTFSESVSTFTSADVTLGGTAGATAAAVSGSGSTYTVTVTGMNQSGTVTVAVPAGVVSDDAGNLNLASPTPGLVNFTLVSDFVVVASQGSAPLVQVFDSKTGAQKFSFLAYDSQFLGGVRAVLADVNGDGVPDIITAPGPSGGPDIRVFDGVTGKMIQEFMAFDPRWLGGDFVAAGHFEGTNQMDIVVGADAGGGPEVRVFSGADAHNIDSFFAYDPRFTGGVRVAVGNIGNGHDDIITGAGPGGGPHVKVFDGANINNVLLSFMAYDVGFPGGVFVAAGDTTGAGVADIITGAGPSGGPHVKVFSPTLQVLQSFYAYDPTYTGGVQVASFPDIDNDPGLEIQTTQGTTAISGPTMKIFDGTTLAELDSMYAFLNPTLGGIFVGGR